MKKNILLISLLFIIISLQAQDYLISFAGSGQSSSLSSVTVENLTQLKSVTLNGSEILHLVKTITRIEPISDYESELMIYPNPSNGNSTIDFVATTSGKVNIELFDITGKRVCVTQNLLTIGRHSYQVSNLYGGIYTIRISSQGYTYTGKLVSNGDSNLDKRISYNRISDISVSSMKLKSAYTEKLMQYNPGDRLKIIGSSEKYSTVVVDVPTQSKTITFIFVACSDADGNNYPVVQIGAKVWMAENLKTTKYNDGTSITCITDNLAWAGLTTAAYCWYNNNETTNKNTYGALYNWYAVNTGKLCPIGWHMPSDAEWGELTTYLGTDNIAGKLREAGNKHWFNPNTGATNESGFTALPGGQRSEFGVFDFAWWNGLWWTSTGISEQLAYGIWIAADLVDVFHSMEDKKQGYSLRCIKD